MSALGWIYAAPQIDQRLTSTYQTAKVAMTDTAIGYTRLSQDSDVSIDRQKRHIREYADEHRFELTDIYDDGEYSSGFETESRAQYQTLQGIVERGETDAVLVNSKRRLARDFDETMRLILDLRREDIQLHTYEDGQVALEDPMQVAIEVVQAASEHKAKRKEIERAIDAVEERQANGCYQGRTPFGLQFAEDGCHLEKDTEEWETLQEVWQLLERGRDYESIKETTGVSKASVSRINERGRGYYEGLLSEFGV